MIPTHPNLTRRSAALALCGIVLMLWMSFAYIDHQYDISSVHHSDHHCQLFSCAQYGMGHASLTLIDASLPDVFVVQDDYHFYQRPTFAYQARSPPVKLIS
ncbi:hypothetical protein BA953_10700 [Vibrio coralliilyticus]|uniref:DUF2607 family protein n=1 Tax=Vibrio coralliilyticus TaxID=190893 RepID=UPI0008106399|nr:DUF2607 family protein [Vibrio coralliilyticus]ANW24626.1 hypothetical protein BA953_10700 [Vibrio coralliilyticus]